MVQILPVVAYSRYGACPACGGSGEVDTVYHLSPRELNILALAARGFTLKEAAMHAGIKYQTAKNYTAIAYAKLGVASLSAAVYKLWLRKHFAEEQYANPLDSPALLLGAL